MREWLKRKFDNFIRKHTGWVIAEDCFIVVRGKIEIERPAKLDARKSSIVLYKSGKSIDTVYSELATWLGKEQPHE